MSQETISHTLPDTVGRYLVHSVVQLQVRDSPVHSRRPKAQAMLIRVSKAKSIDMTKLTMMVDSTDLVGSFLSDVIQKLFIRRIESISKLEL
jgi:hypothetical protein